jgi:hypothetical protein
MTLNGFSNRRITGDKAPVIANYHANRTFITTSAHAVTAV